MCALRSNTAASTTVPAWPLAAACVASGAAALVFQNLWFRAAGLGLGNSVWSAAVVTSAFMAGLGLGNLLTALGHRRITHPGRVYAGVEAVIALAGTAGFWMLFKGQGVIAGWLAPWHDAPGQVAVGRALIAFVVLTLPAMGIGATLPLLVGLRTRAAFGPQLAHLYAWNTLGAVAGSLAAEFGLIRLLGLPATAGVAAVGNVTAAILVWGAASRAVVARASAEATAELATPVSGRQRWSEGTWRLLGTVMVTGFALLALEVLWFRFLQLFFNGSSKTFALMLALVLTGLTLGGAVAARLLKGGGREAWIRPLCWMSSALVVLSYALFPRLQAVVANWSETAALIGLSAGLMVPACVLSGVLFSLIGDALGRRLVHPVRTTGLLTLANTLGAAAGPAVAALWLLPGLGVERAFFALALVYAAAGCIAPSGGTGEPRAWGRTFAQAAVLAVMLALFPFGHMRDRYFAGVVRRLPGAELLQVNEGPAETSFYLGHDSMGRRFYHRLVTNSYSMSSSDPRSMRYMKLFAWLPLALHSEAKDALLICFGVGSTASALAETPSLERIDVVDISADVLGSAALLFEPPVRNPLADARVRTVVEDGRFFLQTTSRRYDLITGEPPPTKIAGVVNLYTEEFFRLVRDRLNDGGYCSYWLPVYQMREDEARAIIRAFLEVFPEATLWEGGGLNWILLGQRGQRPAVTAAEMGRLWTRPKVAADLAQLGLEEPARLAATFLADAEDLAAFCGDTPPLVDAHPHRVSNEIRDRAPLSAEYRALVDATEARRRFESSAWVAQNLPREIRADVGAAFQLQHLMNYALYREYRPAPGAVERDLRSLAALPPARTLAYWLLESTPQQAAWAREDEALGTAGAEARHHLRAARRVEELLGPTGAP